MNEVLDIRMPLSGDGVFTTLQGEGLGTGVKAVFVRFQGCPLACHWIDAATGVDSMCDAAYTWNPALMEKAQWWTIGNILEYVNNEQPVRTVVLTGGEPMIQPHLKDLVKVLLEEGYHVEIETAGIYPPLKLDLPLNLRWLQYNISPKLASSNNPRVKRYKPDVIKAFLQDWVENKSGCIFKFVVASAGDVREVQDEWEEAISIPRPLIAIMPAVTESADQVKMLPWLWEVCKTYDYRLCARLHVFAFGARRRV